MGARYMAIGSRLEPSVRYGTGMREEKSSRPGGSPAHRVIKVGNTRQLWQGGIGVTLAASIEELLGRRQ